MEDTFDTTGDPETPPGGKIKPPTVNQPAGSESDSDIKPPTETATDDSEIPIIPPGSPER